MSVQTQAQACAELTKWYAAREAVTGGQTFSLTTSAGTRLLTYASLKQINDTIILLERKCGTGNTKAKAGLHNFALANMGDNEANP